MNDKKIKKSVVLKLVIYLSCCYKLIYLHAVFFAGGAGRFVVTKTQHLPCFTFFPIRW